MLIHSFSFILNSLLHEARVCEIEDLIPRSDKPAKVNPYTKMVYPLAALGGLFIVSTALMAGVVESRIPCEPPCVPGTEEIMSKKEHGTSHTPVQETLRWNCDRDTADRICNFNRVRFDDHHKQQIAKFTSKVSHSVPPVDFSTMPNIPDTGNPQHFWTKSTRVVTN